jgi:hypothetical protein
MTRNEKILCGAYAIISIVALITTWSNNIVFFMQPENRGMTSFIQALYVNPASASITNDILMFALAGFIFMVHEARRLQIRHVWIYIFFSCLIAVSVMFPIFLIVRQITISKQRA